MCPRWWTLGSGAPGTTFRAKLRGCLTTFTSTLTFLMAFGATKAVVNALAGWLSDRFGRKPVLVAGWVGGWGSPVPMLIIWLRSGRGSSWPTSFSV